MTQNRCHLSPLLFIIEVFDWFSAAGASDAFGDRDVLVLACMLLSEYSSTCTGKRARLFGCLWLELTS